MAPRRQFKYLPFTSKRFSVFTPESQASFQMIIIVFVKVFHRWPTVSCPFVSLEIKHAFNCRLIIPTRETHSVTPVRFYVLREISGLNETHSKGHCDGDR